MNEPRFDIDLGFGSDGEREVRRVLEQIANRDWNGKIEVKRKREHIDPWLYVETHHDPGRTGAFAPSGISVTEAGLWIFVIRDTGMFIAVPTGVVREMLAHPTSRDKTCMNGSCPTRGRLVGLVPLLKWLDDNTIRF